MTDVHVVQTLCDTWRTISNYIHMYTDTPTETTRWRGRGLATMTRGMLVVLTDRSPGCHVTRRAAGSRSSRSAPGSPRPPSCRSPRSPSSAAPCAVTSRRRSTPPPPSSRTRRSPDSAATATHQLFNPLMTSLRICTRAIVYSYITCTCRCINIRDLQKTEIS